MDWDSHELMNMAAARKWERQEKWIFRYSLQKEYGNGDNFILAQRDSFQNSDFQNFKTINLGCFKQYVVSI